mgnify:CR=1 FL=1
MAQKYVVVERKNPLKPQEPAKFYAMARSNRRVDAEKFKAATCIKISRVRFHPGSMLLDMCKAMKYTQVKKGEGSEGDDVVVPDPDEDKGQTPDPSI